MKLIKFIYIRSRDYQVLKKKKYTYKVIYTYNVRIVNHTNFDEKLQGLLNWKSD